MNRVRQLVFIAVYVSIVIALQTALSIINGIELTTILMTSASLFLPLPSSLIIVIVYCLCEGILFGFGDWVLIYFIYWTLVVIITFLLRKIFRKHLILFAISNAFFSFLFGIFFFIEMLIVYGESAAISYYLTGLSGEIIHLCSNFFITLVLYPILSKLIPKVSYLKYKKV